MKLTNLKILGMQRQLECFKLGSKSTTYCKYLKLLLLIISEWMSKKANFTPEKSLNI